MTSDQTTPDTAAISGWFSGRLPDDWTTTAAEIVVDRDEITVVLALAGTDIGTDIGADEAEGRISRFREETRTTRMTIADEAERRYGRKVAWGATVGGSRQVFTTLAVPVMTRLRQSERIVLDTLVDAGVARSRSHALSWCVRLVGDNTATWLADLREAMASVEKVRAAGPA